MAANTWHKDKKSWKKINEFLFKNTSMADCSFLVTVENIVVKIPAHKYVLGGYSPEFYNLFYLLESDSDEIPINDVCGDSFLKFLQFVYTETTELNLDNIEVLMKLAVRYAVESFKDFCENFLMKSVTGENVFSLLDKFSCYDLPNFELKCFKIISSNRLIFDDPSFFDISNKTLTTILKSEELKGFKEITIFRGAEKWSEVFCDKNDREINSNNKRMALGGALKYIRFGDMTIDEFSSCTLDKSVLTPTEIIKVFQCIATDGIINRPYSGDRRISGLKRFEIFKFQIGQTLNTALVQMPGFETFYILRFSTYKPIKFRGFGILGRVDSLDKQNPENFIIQLKDAMKDVVLLNEAVVIHHDGTPKVYELLFNQSIMLEANKSYRVYIKRLKNKLFRNYIQNDDAVINNSTNVDGVKFEIEHKFNYAASIIYED